MVNSSGINMICTFANTYSNYFHKFIQQMILDLLFFTHFDTPIINFPSHIHSLRHF